MLVFYNIELFYTIWCLLKCGPCNLIVIFVFTSYSSRKPSRHLHLDEYLVRACCHDGIKTVKNNGTETQLADEKYIKFV